MSEILQILGHIMDAKREGLPISSHHAWKKVCFHTSISRNIASGIQIAILPLPSQERTDEPMMAER